MEAPLSEAITAPVPSRAPRSLTAILVAGALAACGGSTPPPSPPPVAGVVPAADSSSAPAVADRNERIQELAATPASSPAAGDDGSSSGYAIGPDDLLRVDVFGAPDLSGEHRVSADGEIAVSLVGPVDAGGLSPRELEDRLETKLGEKYMKDPHVTVQVTEMKSHGVSVVGAVNRPGVYQVSGRATLLDVLARAEGLAETAGGSVVVTRGGAASDSSPSRQVDLKELLATGDLSLNVPVRAGDVVKVPEAGKVYVTGQVREPGGFPVRNRESMTALQALALGGGLTGTADANDSYIIRVDENGQRRDIQVNLEEVLQREAEDPRLLAGDVLFVPKSTSKTIFGGIFDAVIRMVTLGTLVR